MNSAPIRVYVANLKKRTDRKASILAQYAGREEFEIHIVPAIEHKNGAWGLWKTFYQIVSMESQKGSPYFIFCEDDHRFTSEYTPDVLFTNIHRVDALGADLLSGGMSWMDKPIQVNDNLFWVNAFNGMQFTVVFKRFYASILSCTTEEGYVTDSFLSRLSDNIFVIYPYISTQEDFGYSDATSANNQKGRVPALFMNTLKQLQWYNKIHQYFHQPRFEDLPSLESPEDIALPTYIINLPNRTDRKRHIELQFAEHKEFDLHFVNACSHSRGNVGLWQSICKIVKKADMDGEEVILICEDDHTFTPNYDRSLFLKQVWEAGMMGTDILSGGIGGFGNLVPVKDGLFWVDWFWCTQFIVIYRRAFSKIINAEFKDTDVADEFLSRLLTNKLIILPFISIQRDFGYSDVTIANNTKGEITRYFKKSKEKADGYLQVVKRYGIMKGEFTLRNGNLSSILSGMPIKALHLGCGENILRGWLNTDLHTHGPVSYLDASEPFPLEKNTLDYIFSEHMFEHLSYENGVSMLKECYRTLKPGGVLRLTMPRLDFLIKLYNEPYKEIHQQYALWSLQQFAPRMYADFVQKHEDLPMALVINNFMHLWGHQMIYDYSSLHKMLENVGFNNIKECLMGISEYPYLQQLEHHGYVIPKWANELESMTIEAVKENINGV